MTADMFAPFLAENDDDVWFVAEGDGAIRGFLYAATERFTEGTRNVFAMATAPEWKGQGIGTALMTSAENHLVERDDRIVLVETSSRPQFDSTVAFDKARGFEQEARIRDYWADGDDKLIFRKALR